MRVFVGTRDRPECGGDHAGFQNGHLRPNARWRDRPLMTGVRTSSITIDGLKPPGRLGYPPGSGRSLAEKIAAIRARRTRCQAMLAQLDRTGEDQISLTDPDS